jgi:hypothetical protein
VSITDGCATLILIRCSYFARFYFFGHFIPNSHVHFGVDIDDELAISSAAIVFAIVLFSFNKHFRHNKLSHTFQLFSPPHLSFRTYVLLMERRVHKYNLTLICALRDPNSSNAHFHVELSCRLPAGSYRHNVTWVVWDTLQVRAAKISSKMLALHSS